MNSFSNMEKICFARNPRKDDVAHQTTSLSRMYVDVYSTHTHTPTHLTHNAMQSCCAAKMCCVMLCFCGLGYIEHKNSVCMIVDCID